MSKRNSYCLKKAECTCDECSRPFILYVNKSVWAYKCSIKGKRKYFCSYTCMRDYLTSLDEENETEDYIYD